MIEATNREKPPGWAHLRRYVSGREIALAVTLIGVIVGAIVLHRVLYPPIYHLTMTTGSFSGANYALATRYLDPEAHAQNVELSMVQTGGSEDTLDAVQQGRVQVAITDGGLSHDGRDDVREVAPLFLTALHVLMRREIYEQAIETRDLRAALRGKTISLSNEGSGTRTFALKVLDRLGVTPAEFTETPRSVAFLTNPRATSDQIPDVVFAASLLPSPVASRLVRDFDYRLYPLDFVDAVRLDDKAAYAVTIPMGTYGLSPDVPDRTVTTLGRRLLLVAHKDVPSEAVTALARAALESDFAKVYDPPLTTKQFELLAEFPRHPGAQAFVASQSPITQETLTGLFQFVGVAGAVACIPPCFIMMRPFLRRRRREGVKSVRHYISTVSELEIEVFAVDEANAASHAEVVAMRHRLNHLKLEAMEAYKQDRLDDVDLMDSFLAHVADLRNHLNALIQTNHRGEEGPPLESYLSTLPPEIPFRTERRGPSPPGEN